jgi:hypothetical protein
MCHMYLGLCNFADLNYTYGHYKARYSFYWSFLKRMYLTCTAWVESLDTPGNCRRENIQIISKIYASILRDLLITGRHLLGVLFVTSLKSNLRTALTTQNTTENNCIISHSQNTTALQPNVFLTGTHRLLVINGPSQAQTTAKVTCILHSQ